MRELPAHWSSMLGAGVFGIPDLGYGSSGIAEQHRTPASVGPGADRQLSTWLTAPLHVADPLTRSVETRAGQWCVEEAKASSVF